MSRTGDLSGEIALRRRRLLVHAAAPGRRHLTQQEPHGACLLLLSGAGVHLDHSIMVSAADLEQRLLGNRCGPPLHCSSGGSASQHVVGGGRSARGAGGRSLHRASGSRPDQRQQQEQKLRWHRALAHEGEQLAAARIQLSSSCGWNLRPIRGQGGGEAVAGGAGDGETSKERVRSVGRSRSPLCTVAGACGGPRVGPSWARPAGARANSSGLECCARAFTRPREVGLEEVSYASDLQEQCE